MTRGERNKAMRAFIEETQRYDWEHLMTAARNAIRSPLSIEVESTLERLHESIRLVGPVNWDSVPWAVYISGLYAFVIGDEHKAALPSNAEYTEAWEAMKPYTNLADAGRCRELVAILKEKKKP